MGRQALIMTFSPQVLPAVPNFQLSVPKLLLKATVKGKQKSTF